MNYENMKYAAVAALPVTEIQDALEHLEPKSTAHDLVTEALIYLNYPQGKDQSNENTAENLLIASRLFISPMNRAHALLADALVILRCWVWQQEKPTDSSDDEYEGFDDDDFIQKIEELESDLMNARVQIITLRKQLAIIEARGTTA